MNTKQITVILITLLAISALFGCTQETNNTNPQGSNQAQVSSPDEITQNATNDIIDETNDIQMEEII